MVKKMSEALCSKQIEPRKPEVVRETNQEKREDVTRADHSTTL